MLRRVVQCVVILGLLVASAVSQTASYVFSGEKLACKGHPNAGRSWTPKFLAKSLPRLGGRLDLEMDSSIPRASQVILFTGLSKSKFGGYKLPFDTRVKISRTWCGNLMTSIDVVTFLITGSIQIPIPNDRSLLGVRFYQQTFQTWMIIRAQFSLSRLGEGVIGT